MIQTNRNKTFLVVSLLVSAGALAFGGVVFRSWVPYACAGLAAGGAILIGLNQTWGVYLPLGALALGVGALLYYKTQRLGYLSGIGPVLTLAGFIVSTYQLELRRRRQQGRRIRAARTSSATTADALRHLADGEPPGDAVGREDSSAEPESTRRVQSLVLLTRGEPQFNSAKVIERLSRWLGVSFSDREGESDNFVVGSGNVFMVKLKYQCIYMITLLRRPYWDSENIAPYELQAGPGDRPTLEDLQGTRGALLIDGHIGPMSETLLGLAKVVAACFSSDASILLSPVAFKAEKVSKELARKLVLAKEPADLLGPLCNFVPLWVDGRIRCMTRGLSLLGLPDVLTVVEDNEEQFNRAMAAVQSVGMYQAHRDRPLSVGDTCSVPECGTYRIAAADDEDPSDVICLVPEELSSSDE